MEQRKRRGSGGREKERGGGREGGRERERVIERDVSTNMTKNLKRLHKFDFKMKS